MKVTRLLMMICLSLLMSSGSVFAKTFCLYDPTGTAGPFVPIWKDVVLEAKKWSLDLNLKVITNEQKVYDMYEKGECDLAAFTTFRVREFNKFVGTLDSFGGLPDYKTAASVYRSVLTQPSISKYLSANGHDILGILPIGQAYLVTKDKALNRLSQIAGKKITALELDPAQQMLIKKVGATSVTTNDALMFPTMFNQGKVDITAVPMVLFKPFEMQKGVGPNGGILKFPLLMVSVTVVAKTGTLPPETIAQSRAYFAKNMPTFINAGKKADSTVSPNLWYSIAEEDTEGYMRMMREVRIELKKKGVYDAKALKLMKAVRCKTYHTEAYDCASPGE